MAVAAVPAGGARPLLCGYCIILGGLGGLVHACHDVIPSPGTGPLGTGVANVGLAERCGAVRWQAELLI